MPSTKKPRSSCASPPERFQSLTKRLLAVPKREVDKLRAEEAKQKQRKPKG